MTAQAKIETIVDGDEILGGRERHPRLRLWLAPAQHEAQIVADDRHCADTGTLISTIHGRTLELEVELTQGALVVADAEKIAALAAEAQPLVDRVVAGYDTRWDGSNTVGTLTADAREAWDALAFLPFKVHHGKLPIVACLMPTVIEVSPLIYQTCT